MTAKPILRVGKIKATGRSTPSSVGGHLARSRPTPNADPKRTRENRWLVGDPKMSIDDAIGAVMSKAGIDRSRLRRDAVLANDVLLTISPEFFRPDAPEASGTYDPDRLEAFVAEAQTFLRKTFGPRVAAAVLHLDEATPHIQAVVVPIMPGKENPRQRRLSSKDMFDPERLSALQQAWEDRLRPHGVGPRTKGSRARHTTLREYYGVLEEARDADMRPTLEIATPPVRGRIESDDAHQKKVAAWKRDQERQLRKTLAPMAKAAARGRLYDAEKRSNSVLRGELAEKATALTEAYEKLGADKEMLDRLRGAPINQVAAALGWTDPIGKKQNAIDLVKAAGGLDYKQAVAWLAQNFGAATAAAGVRDAAADQVKTLAGGERVFTKGEITKRAIIRRQLDALAAPAYRVTAMRNKNDEQIGQNVGKSILEKDLLTADEIVELIPRLTAMNIGGANIFVTPVEDGIHHVLVDDLSSETLRALRDRGYQPATITETSAGNFQAVIKVAGPKAAANEWFKDLNRDLGDERITGLGHPFRIAGFENRKPRHRGADGKFPFVRIVTAVNMLCSRSAGVIRAYMARISPEGLLDRRRGPEGPFQRLGERSEAQSADAARRTPSPRR